MTDALRQQAKAPASGRESLVQVVADFLFDVETMQRVLDRVSEGDAPCAQWLIEALRDRSEGAVREQQAQQMQQ